MNARALLIEFDSADALQRARTALFDEGWTRARHLHADAAHRGRNRARTVSTFAPHGRTDRRMIGGLGCFAMECYAAMFDYPIDVAGRPDASLIAFVPPALETTLLGAALGMVIAFLFAARLPRFHHPLFDVEDFAHASDHRYFLMIDANDGHRERLHDTLRALHAVSVHEVRDDA